MQTLPIRFITSSRGPANSLEPDDFVFLGSEPDYPRAVQRLNDFEQAFKAEVSRHDLVIYRMSRPAKGIYLWRQGSNSQGDDRGNEPAGAKLIGYSIYAGPKGFAEQDPTPPNMSKMTQGVLSIGSAYGQHGPPSDGGP